jgi:hypothetical protein
MTSPPPPDPAETQKRLTGLRDFLATCLGGMGAVSDRGYSPGTKEAGGLLPGADFVLEAGSHRFDIVIIERY